MSKVVVVYWSGTGNTASMADAVAEGARNAGAEVAQFEVTETSAADVAAYDCIALGCPAMGAEVLEENDFEPFFADLESKLNGKKVALFGSYGWGDGQWMRDWYDRTSNAGANMCGDEGLIINETPDDDGLASCRDLGAALAN